MVAPLRRSQLTPLSILVHRPLGMPNQMVSFECAFDIIVFIVANQNVAFGSIFDENDYIVVFSDHHNFHAQI